MMIAEYPRKSATEINYVQRIMILYADVTGKHMQINVSHLANALIRLLLANAESSISQSKFNH